MFHTPLIKKNSKIQKGAWVVNPESSGLELGKVKETYDEEKLFDLIIYNSKGGKIGRISPALNGPKKFEPCLEQKEFIVIQKPIFPIALKLHGAPLFRET